jgi:hypothetical protein
LYTPDVRVVRRLQRLDLDGCESAPLRVVQTDGDVHSAAFGLDPEELVSATCVVLDNSH